jgi:transcriptional regulator with XRE-family HTH domain
VSGDRQKLRDHFATTVERLRASRGMSVETLAVRSLHEPAEVEEILRGEVDPGLDSVFLLAGALCVPPEELLKGISWRPDLEGGGSYLVDDDE